MIPRSAILVCAALLLAGCIRLEPHLGPNDMPQVIAVSSFDNRSGFEGEWKLGNGMADLLISELVRTKCFTVVEREHFNRLVDELHRQRNDNLFRPEGRTSMGRMKNAQYQIRGVINDFSQVGGSALWVMVKKLLMGGRGYTARVSLTLTLIEVESGQIINSIQCIGSAPAYEVYIDGKYKNIAFGGDAFFRTPLGNATQEAIRKGVTAIIREMPKNEWKPMVVGMSGKYVILNGGKNRSYKAGSTMLVRGAAQPITDPNTGDILEFLAGPKIATIRIVDVRDRISFAEVVEGTGIQRGQWIEPAPPASEKRTTSP